MPARSRALAGMKSMSLTNTLSIKANKIQLYCLNPTVKNHILCSLIMLFQRNVCFVK